MYKKDKYQNIFSGTYNREWVQIRNTIRAVVRLCTRLRSHKRLSEFGSKGHLMKLNF